MKGELLSVIVPVYNGAAYIEKCIDSVERQTYSNIEIIVVDDGSFDNTNDVLALLQKKYPNIKVIHQNNGGVSSARNRGISEANGKYIAFLDSDDTIENEYYDKCISNFEANVDIVTNLDYSIRKSCFESDKISPEEGIRNLLLLKLPSSVWANVYRTSLLKGIAFDESIHFFEDLWFNYLCLLSTHNIKLFESQGYHYNNRPDSLSHSKLSSRRMSCLTIVDNLYERKCDLDYPLEFGFFFSHVLVSLITQLSFFLDKNHRNYVREIKKRSYKCYKDNKHNYLIPKSYKAALFFTAYFTNFVCFAAIIKRKIHKVR